MLLFSSTDSERKIHDKILKIFYLEIPDWAINPFLYDASSAHHNLHEEIIDLQNDF